MSLHPTDQRPLGDEARHALAMLRHYHIIEWPVETRKKGRWMPIYEARIKLGGTGNVQQTVTVKADDNAKAKLLLEAQYGKGSVMTVPVKKG